MKPAYITINRWTGPKTVPATCYFRLLDGPPHPLMTATICSTSSLIEVRSLLPAS